MNPWVPDLPCLRVGRANLDLTSAIINSHCEFMVLVVITHLEDSNLPPSSNLAALTQIILLFT